uniref:Transposase n=1 Tax=Loa loa TaxID=7209 RepID=A0A1I7V5C0_LOALO
MIPEYGWECSDSSLHGKRTNEAGKAIHFIRSHLGLMRFGKRNAAQYGIIRFNKRIDLDHLTQQNDEGNSIDSDNGYRNSYIKAYPFGY